MDDEFRVYHERQESALCARHCLNNLLQGPYFTEMDLAHIAQELDKEEQALMGSEDTGMLNWLQANKESQNVSLDGNFSIQVLRRALSNLHLELIQFGSVAAEAAQKEPEKQQAFICNLQAHWFAIRRIGGHWLDLNSLSGLPETDAKPCKISDFFLSAKIASLQDQGYSIFWVVGEFPHAQAGMDVLHGGNCQWYPLTQLQSRDKTYPKNLLSQVNRSAAGHSNFARGGDPLLEAALQASLADSGGGGGGSGFGMQGNGMGMQSGNYMSGGNYAWGNQQPQSFNRSESQDNDVQMAIAMSMASAANPTTNPNAVPIARIPSTGSSFDADDAELRAALAMSMEEDEDHEENLAQKDPPNTTFSTSTTNANASNTHVAASEEEKAGPKEDAEQVPTIDEVDDSVPASEKCEIVMRLPDGSLLQRWFLRTHSIGDIITYIHSQPSGQKLDRSKKYEFLIPPTDLHSNPTETVADMCQNVPRMRLTVRYGKDPSPEANDNDPSSQS